MLCVLAWVKIVVLACCLVACAGGFVCLLLLLTHSPRLVPSSSSYAAYALCVLFYDAPHITNNDCF